jgi:ectoine hydroxylase-related dioxygenase (phytanoyl-CoA dioxygenase family)
MEKHPLNTGFLWQQPPPPYELITQAQAQAYHDRGGFVLRDTFSETEIAELVDALDPLEARANAALADLPATQPSIARADEIVFAAHIVTQSATARSFSQHPVLQSLCRDLIGPKVRLYWDQLVYKRPGTREDFPWHQDNGYNFVTPQQYLTCWVALTDATADNGCPWIAPGLHQQGTLAHRWTPLGFACLDNTPEDACLLPVPAGSVAVFSSLTPHRTGPNLTRHPRKAYILQYAPDGAMVHPRQGESFAADDPLRQYLVVN